MEEHACILFVLRFQLKDSQSQLQNGLCVLATALRANVALQLELRTRSHPSTPRLIQAQPSASLAFPCRNSMAQRTPSTNKSVLGAIKKTQPCNARPRGHIAKVVAVEGLLPVFSRLCQLAFCPSLTSKACSGTGFLSYRQPPPLSTDILEALRSCGGFCSSLIFNMFVSGARTSLPALGFL